MACQAEDPFAQRGGIAAADLIRKPPVESERGGFVQKRPQGDRQRPGYNQGAQMTRGRRSFRVAEEDEEDGEDVNLTKEERDLVGPWDIFYFSFI